MEVLCIGLPSDRHAHVVPALSYARHDLFPQDSRSSYDRASHVTLPSSARFSAPYASAERIGGLKRIGSPAVLESFVTPLVGSRGGREDRVAFRPCLSAGLALSMLLSN